MKRPLRPDERILWGVVTSTVKPATTRYAAPAEAQDPPAHLPPPVKAPPKFIKPPKAQLPVQAVAPKPKPKPAPAPAGAIEPRRKHRIVKERDDLGARIDLHGLDQDAARAALHGFVLRAQSEGIRAVLVITGKGNLGDGILRKRTPDWLAEPVVRHAVAGVSEAARHHGGAGALYVALKRKP